MEKRLSKHVISKETFCKALQLIREQEEVDRQFSEALQTVGNGHYVFGTPNRCLDAAILVLVEAVGDKYELGDKIIELADGSQTWDLTTPEALYDYIVNVCN